MTNLSWLTKRPIAHRGLHDKDNHIIENTTSAFAAAMLNDFAIETDLQLTKDGEAAVFHDATQDRLLKTKGPIIDVTMKQLKQAKFKSTDDRIQSLGELLDQVAGKVPLVLEIKSQRGNEGLLERRIADVIADYKGQLALMSFSQTSIALVRDHAPSRPRGLVSEHMHWAHIKGYQQTRFDFLAYKAQNLPALAPLCVKYIFKLPLLAWTVRTRKDHMKARWADQIIFENYDPETIISPWTQMPSTH